MCYCPRPRGRKRVFWSCVSIAFPTSLRRSSVSNVDKLSVFQPSNYITEHQRGVIAPKGVNSVVGKGTSDYEWEWGTRTPRGRVKVNLCMCVAVCYIRIIHYECSMFSWTLECTVKRGFMWLMWTERECDMCFCVLLFTVLTSFTNWWLHME